jgi:hypothetical protein
VRISCFTLKCINLRAFPSYQVSLSAWANLDFDFSFTLRDTNHQNRQSLEIFNLSFAGLVLLDIPITNIVSTSIFTFANLGSG